MNEENSLKFFLPTTCPHCKKNIVIAGSQKALSIDTVLSDKEIADAKTDLKTKIEGLGLAEAKKKEIIAWVDDENTFFGPDDVTAIVGNILNTQEK